MVWEELGFPSLFIQQYFLKQKSAQVTTAVSGCEGCVGGGGGGGGGLLHSALLCLGPEVAEGMCLSPARVQVGRWFWEGP